MMRPVKHEPDAPRGPRSQQTRPDLARNASVNERPSYWIGFVVAALVKHSCCDAIGQNLCAEDCERRQCCLRYSRIW